MQSERETEERRDERLNEDDASATLSVRCISGNDEQKLCRKLSTSCLMVKESLTVNIPENSTTNVEFSVTCKAKMDVKVACTPKLVVQSWILSWFKAKA